MNIILIPLLEVLHMALGIYVHLVVIHVIASWLIAFDVINTRNRFVYLVLDFLDRITEPAYRRIRRYLPPMGGIDLSPILLLLGVYFVQGVITQTLMNLAMPAG